MGDVSWHEYRVSQELELQGLPFYALIMGAMRQADTHNADILKRAFPKTWAELEARYHAPGGNLPGENVVIEGAHNEGE